MTSTTSDWDTDLPSNPVEEYAALTRAIYRTEGFSILFIVCDPQNEDELLKRLYFDVPPRDTQYLKLKADSANFYERVEQLFANSPAWIGDPLALTKYLIVRGLELPLLAYQQSKREQGWSEEDVQPSSLKGVPPILVNLNQQRDRLRDNFPICFIFVITQFVQEFLIHRAPDFYDWRSGVFLRPNVKTCESCLSFHNDGVPGVLYEDPIVSCIHPSEEAENLWEEMTIDAAFTCPHYNCNPHYGDVLLPDPEPEWEYSEPPF